MGEAAVRIARSAGYYNAGTVEFLVDQNANFYFLEMNTRLQVEHPVTELVTGRDLVHLQVLVAAGRELPFRQDDVAWRGHAIECRIYAEDADNGFLPSPGRIAQIERPAGPGIRFDSGIYAGWEAPIEYDPLLAKLAVWAESRESAISRMDRALSECYITGIKTNLRFFRQVIDDEEFIAGNLHTQFIEEFFSRRADQTNEGHLEVEAVSALAAAVFSMRTRKEATERPEAGSRWLTDGRARLMQ
jgi:acetyl-CoA carboxylase biotin carboxylase subunit